MEVGDHERDRLRRLVVQEVDDLLGRRAAQELERPHFDHGREAADDVHRPGRPECLFEHFTGVLDAAGGERVIRRHGGDHLFEHAFGRRRLDALELGHLQRQRLDLVLAQVAEDVGGPLFAERDEQHGGLLAPVHGRAGRRMGFTGFELRWHDEP